MKIDPNWIIAISTSCGVLVAWYQLRNLRKELRMNSLMAVLEIESEMNGRKVALDEISYKIRKLEYANELDEKLSEILEDEQESALENYLNSIDRLSYCILKNYLPDRDWNSEYRDLIITTVRESEDKFGAGTYYLNIKDLYEKWQRS